MRNWWAVAASITALLLSISTLYFWSEKSKIEKEYIVIAEQLKNAENDLLVQQAKIKDPFRAVLISEPAFNNA